MGLARLLGLPSLRAYPVADGVAVTKRSMNATMGVMACLSK